MNTNPPRDETYFEGETLPQVIHIDKANRTCLVKVAPNKSVIAHLTKEKAEAIQLLDYVEIKKSPVTGEINVIRYYVNQDVYNEEYYQEVLI